MAGTKWQPHSSDPAPDWFLEPRCWWTTSSLLRLRAKAVEGQTLNAVVFRSIIDHLGWNMPFLQNAFLALVLAFEAGLLLVGAQTGFLDGPAVLSNMASDYWVPRHFRDLSARLVRQNGRLVGG